MRITLTQKLLFGVVAVPILFSGAAMAQVVKPEAYVVDDRGVVARNTSTLGNLCWHTTDWTPAKAIYECEPDLVPKKIAAAPPAAKPVPPAPVPPPPPASKMHFSADELFDFDKAVLKHSPSRDQLDEFAARLKTLNFNTVKVIGYTDRIGSDHYNMHLSQRRADAVKNYLITQGVPGGKIQAEGRGKADPVTEDRCKGGKGKATKALIACLAPDRRVIVEVDGTREIKIQN